MKVEEGRQLRIIPGFTEVALWREEEDPHGFYDHDDKGFYIYWNVFRLNGELVRQKSKYNNNLEW